MRSNDVIGDDSQPLEHSNPQQGRDVSETESTCDDPRVLKEHAPLRIAKLESLRAAIQQGIDSGPGVPANEVFAALRERIRNGHR